MLVAGKDFNMGNDLSPMWINENLVKAKSDLKKAEVAYNSLLKKDTQYAAGVYRLMEAKRKVVDVWINA
jgi:hypothetical protein